jgi:hypothetical protein
LFNHVQVGCSFINIWHNLPTSTTPKELSKANFKNEICQVDIEIVEETWANQVLLEHLPTSLQIARMLFCERMSMSGEHVNTNKWTWTNIFWNILLTSTKYFENIIWHMGHNIWWSGGIFCHVFIDECYLWMINENGWTFRECWQ